MKDIHGKTKDGVPVVAYVAFSRSKAPCLIAVDLPGDKGFMFKTSLSVNAAKAVMAAVPSINYADLKPLIRRVKVRISMVDEGERR